MLPAHGRLLTQGVRVARGMVGSFRVSLVNQQVSFPTTREFSRPPVHRQSRPVTALTCRRGSRSPTPSSCLLGSRTLCWGGWIGAGQRLSFLPTLGRSHALHRSEPDADAGANTHTRARTEVEEGASILDLPSAHNFTTTVLADFVQMSSFLKGGLSCQTQLRLNKGGTLTFAFLSKPTAPPRSDSW